MRNRQNQPVSPIACRSIELDKPIAEVTGLDRYDTLRILPRWKGWPLAPIELPVKDGRIGAAEISAALVNGTTDAAMKRSIARWLENHGTATATPQELFAASTHKSSAENVSIVVCTRDRSNQLRTCLESLERLDPAPLEIIIVDNAPSDSSTADLVNEEFPHLVYVPEPRPGLDWARNAGADRARGDIIAYTDDDVRVDPRWAGALADAFASAPDIVAVTGLVEPAELETEAQQLFEYQGGFGRGYEPRWVRVPSSRKDRWPYYGTGSYGTGANFALHRRALEALGGFDTALDVGTITNGGGDLEMMSRVLANGDTLCYWPAAIVFHFHRRDHSQLYRQLENNGRGSLAMFLAMWSRCPSERPAIARIVAWWATMWLFKPSLKWILGRRDFLARLRMRELKGAIVNPLCYFTARKKALEIEHQHGASMPSLAPKAPNERRSGAHARGVAQREIDISRAIVAIDDAAEYDEIDILVRKNDSLLGTMRVWHHGRILGGQEITTAVADWFGPWVLAPEPAYSPADWNDTFSAQFSGIFHAGPVPPESPPAPDDPEPMFVSVVLATLDRPDDLRRALSSLQGVRSKHKIEVVVVDNNPSSGLTETVVNAFRDVRYVPETRRGLAYARNAGFRAARGEIMVATDDDVIVPRNWLDQLCRPFADPAVGAVTGNVLPLVLDNSSERQFEEYGGLGRGYTRRVFDHHWLTGGVNGAATWEIGATANAAFRAELFTDRRVGLMDEALGPGMPSGVGEDTYLFYRTLLAGWRIVYEPSAYVRHKHRATPEALRKQIFSYSKGHVSYLITTWLRNGDRSSLRRLLFVLPRWHAATIWKWIKTLVRLKRPAYPLHLTMLEIAGNLMGPIALFRSRRRVVREGRSGDAVSGGISYIRSEDRAADTIKVGA